MANRSYTILTITGSDGTGESGVQSDIGTISALGCRAVSAITSITSQNTLGIQQIFDLPANVVGAQVEALINDVEPDAVKVGMIRNVAALATIVDMLSKYKCRHVVYDPIVRSSRGDFLMSGDVVAQVRNRLLPLCEVLIMKRKDASAMLRRPDLDAADRQSVEDQLICYGCKKVLLLNDEDSPLHGQANTLASAVACFLSQGRPLEQAIAEARSYVGTQIFRAEKLSGRSSELYNDFLDEISRHYQTNSDVAFYADCLNVSPRYLAQVTKRVSGKSPKLIIDEMLSDEIERQLMATSKTVQEIAYSLGFSSQAHLSKFFKKTKGVSPSATRSKRN